MQFSCSKCNRNFATRGDAFAHQANCAMKKRPRGLNDPIPTRKEGDSTVVEFLRGALQSTNLTCHERLTILPTVASEKIVLHCEPDGTPNRRRDWVMIHWEDGVGTHPARLEAIFNAGPNSNFIAVSSLDISPPNDRRTAAIPFIRKMLSSTIYVLQTTSISAEAVVIEDLDTPGCFWLVPEFKHWPDVLSSV